MADIEILETYVALCHDCDWFGRETVDWSEAEAAGNAHVCPSNHANGSSE